jgi:4-hydroxybenzoate polyprenyltransferase
MDSTSETKLTASGAGRRTLDTLAGLLVSMRPKQWTKNAFVFVPLVFDRKLFDPTSVVRTLIAFVLLCAMSSAVYLMNDLADMASDRLHPVKRHRPLASGRLNPMVARVAFFVLALSSLAVGYLLSPMLAVVLLVYLVLQLAYTFRLKHMVILDILAVAAGFVLRIGAGVAVISVERFSPWLYVFGGFLALFLVVGKRRHELVLLGQGAGEHRAILSEYNLELIDRMQNIVVTSALIAYSTYTFLAEGLPDNHTMMLTIPFVLYGFFRYLYLVYMRGEGGEPETILLKDRPLQIALVLWALTAVAVLYLF